MCLLGVERGLKAPVPLLCFPLPCHGAMHFCTPTAQHRALYLPVCLACGEQRDSKAKFPPTLCRQLLSGKCPPGQGEDRIYDIWHL